jgi:hypothetical protein
MRYRRLANRVVDALQRFEHFQHVDLRTIAADDRPPKL